MINFNDSQLVISDPTLDFSPENRIRQSFLTIHPGQYNVEVTADEFNELNVESVKFTHASLTSNPWYFEQSSITWNSGAVVVCTKNEFIARQAGFFAAEVQAAINLYSASYVGSNVFGIRPFYNKNAPFTITEPKTRNGPYRLPHIELRVLKSPKGIVGLRLDFITR